MTFTQIPQHYTPLGGKAVYTVTQETTGNIDIRIFNAADNTLIGAKRYAAVSEASADIAPCLRRIVRFTPSTGGTGFHTDPGRSPMVHVEAQTEQISVTAPTRIFLPCATTVQAPAMLSSMPAQRLISAGECDELSLLTGGECVVTVTAQAGDTIAAQSYRAPFAGLHFFRLDTADFPEAETLTVDAGACGEVHYTLIQASPEGVRLAWRSAAGSIEHYTFPVVRTTTVSASKKRAYGTDGHIAAGNAERRIRLVSAYESQTVLEALTELFTTPEVWTAEGGHYTPVDVVSEEAVIRREGAMNCLEAEIRPRKKTCMPWN